MEATNAAKFTRTSVSRPEVTSLAAYYRQQHAARLRAPDFFAVCHGVRNGAEVRAFAAAFQRRVIGTDCAATILQVPDGFLCDFTACPDLWRGRVDWLYSNAWDHAPDLPATVRHWRGLLRDDGLLALQWTPQHAVDTGLTREALLALLRWHGYTVKASWPIVASGRIVDAVRVRAQALLRRLIPEAPLGYSVAWSAAPETWVIVARR